MVSLSVLVGWEGGGGGGGGVRIVSLAVTER